MKLFRWICHGLRPCRRPPCGGRGLKFPAPPGLRNNWPSPPVWGAWVEIVHVHVADAKKVVAPRVGGVG